MRGQDPHAIENPRMSQIEILESARASRAGFGVAQKQAFLRWESELQFARARWPGRETRVVREKGRIRHLQKAERALAFSIRAIREWSRWDRDIEGEAATGSSEQEGTRASFKSTVGKIFSVFSKLRLKDFGEG